MATTRPELHSFRIAHPVIQTTSRFEVTAALSLSAAAMILWLIVVPIEFLLPITV